MFTEQDISGPPMPRLAVGLCAGTVHPFRANTCMHFVGAVTNNATIYNVDNGPARFHVGGGATNSLKSCKKIGTVITGEPSSVTGPVFTEGHGQPETVVFVDIRRMANPANGFNVDLFSCNLSQPPPDWDFISKATFNEKMLQATPSLLLHAANSNYNVYTSEATNGALSAVNVSWNRSEQFGLYDLQVVKFS